MQKNLILAAIASTVVLPAAAIDMALYEPVPEVDMEFKNFLQLLYAETEDPASTTTFTDYFPADGTLIVRSNTAVGAEEILALKHALMPTDGSKLWNHLPNVTTVYSESDKQKTFEVLGVIQSTFEGGNCSQAYYSTRFSIAKYNGVTDLRVRSGSLLVYDDYLISPERTPTDIPCQ